MIPNDFQTPEKKREHKRVKSFAGTLKQEIASPLIDKNTLIMFSEKKNEKSTPHLISSSSLVSKSI